MANVQIRIDDNLKEKAQAVAMGMGLDLPSVVRVFLVQMVRENGLPFRLYGDPFYSVSNQAALEKAIADLNAGKGIVKTMAELESMAE